MMLSRRILLFALSAYLAAAAAAVAATERIPRAQRNKVRWHDLTLDRCTYLWRLWVQVPKPGPCIVFPPAPVLPLPGLAMLR
jgi:hypothetical protein